MRRLFLEVIEEIGTYLGKELVTEFEHARISVQSYPDFDLAGWDVQSGWRTQMSVCAAHLRG